VWKRINQAGVNGEIGVKVMRQLYPIGLSYKAQKITIGIERPSSAAGIKFNSSLIIAIKGCFRDTSTGYAKDEIYGLIPDPLHRNNLDGLARNDAAQLSAILDIFQNRHIPSATCTGIESAQHSSLLETHGQTG
jgi:hypothetical protein